MMQQLKYINGYFLKNMTGFIIASFAIWRVLLFVVAGVGASFWAFLPRFPYSEIFLTNSGLPAWIWSFANFDGVHYLTIAKSGYSAQFTQVFFPLFPILLGLVDKILFFVNPIINGLLISNFCFLISLLIFSRLLSIDYKSDHIKWMILFVLIIPTSFYFGGLYTESFFFLFVISSFLAARKKRWWLSGILGALASATRLVGIFLLPALLWEWWEPNKLKIKNEKLKMTIKNSKISKYYYNILHTAYYILHTPIFYLVPLGLVAYMVYLQIAFGDWLYFWHVQPVFGADRSGSSIILLPQVIWRYIKILTSIPIAKESFWIPLLELTSTISAIVLLVIAHIRKVRLSYLIFSWLAVLTPTMTGTFSSMPRYILVAFPIFIALGLIKSRPFKILLSVICCLLSAIVTILFTRGHWVS